MHVNSHVAMACAFHEAGFEAVHLTDLQTGRVNLGTYQGQSKRLARAGLLRLAVQTTLGCAVPCAVWRVACAAWRGLALRVVIRPWPNRGACRYPCLPPWWQEQDSASHRKQAAACYCRSQKRCSKASKGAQAPCIAPSRASPQWTRPTMDQAGAGRDLSAGDVDAREAGHGQQQTGQQRGWAKAQAGVQLPVLDAQGGADGQGHEVQQGCAHQVGAERGQ